MAQTLQRCHRSTAGRDGGGPSEPKCSSAAAAPSAQKSPRGSCCRRDGEGKEPRSGSPHAAVVELVAGNSAEVKSWPMPTETPSSRATTGRRKYWSGSPSTTLQHWQPPCSNLASRVRARIGAGEVAHPGGLKRSRTGSARSFFTEHRRAYPRSASGRAAAGTARRHHRLGPHLLVGEQRLEHGRRQALLDVNLRRSGCRPGASGLGLMMTAKRFCDNVLRLRRERFGPEPENLPAWRRGRRAKAVDRQKMGQGWRDGE